MLILTIRTDQPQAELGLYDDIRSVDYEKWLAHRQLAETIHQKINNLLQRQDKTLNDIRAMVVFRGPGSFTGLRIGITTANALAYALSLPIVAAGGLDWQESGIAKVLKGANDKLIVPEYGALPHISKPSAR